MIINKLREFAAWICAQIYSLIAWLYELFMNISRVEILKDGDVEAIYTRITMILAIIMVFYVTFEFVKFVVQPEGLTDKEKGAPKIVTKMIIVVLLIAFVPKIFSIAYDVQNKIFDNQVFSKIILGKQDVDVSSAGRNFSSNMLGMFYYVDLNIEWQNQDDGEDCETLSCQQIVSLNHSYLKEYGKLPFLEMGLDQKGKVVEAKTGETLEEYKITFDALFAIIVGGFVAYMLILYCIDAGVRVAQLAFLQIIAPIPIIGYLTPKKDGIFQKWTKQCLTTYLDLFIRVGIIYFILLLFQILGNSFTAGTILEHVEVTGTMKTFMYIALVMGLLLFAHKAPKMISDLFPQKNVASGKFGLKAGERVAPEAARAIGAGLGSTRLIGGAISRGVNTARRNKQERDRTGETRKQQRERHQQEKEDYIKANREYKQAIRNRNRSTKNGKSLTEEESKKLKEARDKYQETRDKVADNKNKKYRSVGLNALAGAATGAATGIKHGAKSTKLEDIGKNVKAGYEADKKAIENREKWLDSGGGSNFDRIVSGIEKRIGITTETGQIQREIKQIDDEIKTNETLIAAESDTKSKRDDVENRLTSKLESGELKTVIGAEEAAYLRKKVGEHIDLRDGDTISTAYRRTVAAAEAAKSNLDSIIKEKGADSEDAKIAQNVYQKAEQTVTDMRKHGMRAAYTYMLKNPNDADYTDAVAVEKQKTMIETVVNANRNSATVASFEAETNKKLDEERKIIINNDKLTENQKSQMISDVNDKYQSQINAFKGLKDFEDYDELDEIVTRLQNIADARMRENMYYKETKRRIETSNYLQAAQADDASHGGGK